MRIAFVGDSLTEGRPGSSYLAVLRQRLPGHTLANLGQGNDTAISLYRRLARMRFGEPFDVAFLLIGVNDVAAGSPWAFSAINALLCKPPSKNHDEFVVYYRATLDLLCRHARRVLAVSPLLKGEDLASPGNHELGVLAGLIQELAAGYACAEYLDVRSAFIRQLAGKPASGYLPTSVVRVALDALTLRSDEQVDRESHKRQLYLTLDGIHLNSAGARLVADCFMAAITGPILEIARGPESGSSRRACHRCC